MIRNCNLLLGATAAAYCLLWTACGPRPQPQVITAPELPVRILVIDDPPLAASIEQTWAERGEGEIQVTTRDSSDVLDSPRKVLDADLVVYPLAMLGALAERDMLEPLSDATRRDANLAVNDYYPSIRLTTTNWDREMMGACLGASELLLLYRQDVLDKLQAEPPQTWQQYHDLAARMRDPAAVGKLAGDPAQWLGAIEPGSLSSSLLFARAACFSGDDTEASIAWEFRQMTPKITSEPFVQALSLMRDGNVDRSIASPLDCYQTLRTGHCGMAIAWPSRHAGRAEDDLPETPLPIRCAVLPGAAKTFRSDDWMTLDEPRRAPLAAVEGRMISVTREAQRRDTASSRLVWIAGKELGEVISLASSATMPCRKSARDFRRWTGGSLDEAGLSTFSDVMDEVSQRQKSLVVLRIPGRQRYVAALEAAISGDEPPREALAKAAAAWEQITNELGRREQKDALSNSLGF